MRRGRIVVCDLCREAVRDTVSADRLGWDWFTGDLPFTVHFCPKCQNKEERRRLFAESQKTT